MARVVDRIREFAAADLKYWEQSALDKISSGCVLDAKDYDELLRDYMMDAGLVPKANSSAAVSGNRSVRGSEKKDTERKKEAARRGWKICTAQHDS